MTKESLYRALVGAPGPSRRVFGKLPRSVGIAGRNVPGIGLGPGSGWAGIGLGRQGAWSRAAEAHGLSVRTIRC